MAEMVNVIAFSEDTTSEQEGFLVSTEGLTFGAENRVSRRTHRPVPLIASIRLYLFEGEGRSSILGNLDHDPS